MSKTLIEIPNSEKHPSDRTHCPRGHSLSGENLYKSPNGRRGCRRCRKRQNREHRRRVAESQWR